MTRTVLVNDDEYGGLRERTIADLDRSNAVRRAFVARYRVTERGMPPRIVNHCGRHMRFWLMPLMFFCPMCGHTETLEAIEARDAS